MAKLPLELAPPDYTPASPWSTWEDLLLASAVLKHGTCNWDMVSSELRSRAFFPSSLSLFSAEACKCRFWILNGRFSSPDRSKTMGGNIPWFEEVRKLRIAQLKRELEQYDGSIGLLQKKLKQLQAECAEFQVATAAEELAKEGNVIKQKCNFSKRVIELSSENDVSKMVDQVRNSDPSQQGLSKCLNGDQEMSLIRKTSDLSKTYGMVSLLLTMNNEAQEELGDQVLPCRSSLENKIGHSNNEDARHVDSCRIAAVETCASRYKEENVPDELDATIMVKEPSKGDSCQHSTSEGCVAMNPISSPVFEESIDCGSENMNGSLLTVGAISNHASSLSNINEGIDNGSEEIKVTQIQLLPKELVPMHECAASEMTDVSHVKANHLKICERNLLPGVNAMDLLRLAYEDGPSVSSAETMGAKNLECQEILESEASSLVLSSETDKHKISLTGTEMEMVFKKGSNNAEVAPMESKDISLCTANNQTLREIGNVSDIDGVCEIAGDDLDYESQMLTEKECTCVHPEHTLKQSSFNRKSTYPNRKNLSAVSCSSTKHKSKRMIECTDISILDSSNNPTICPDGGSSEEKGAASKIGEPVAKKVGDEDVTIEYKSLECMGEQHQVVHLTAYEKRITVFLSENTSMSERVANVSVKHVDQESVTGQREGGHVYEVGDRTKDCELYAMSSDSQKVSEEPYTKKQISYGFVNNGRQRDSTLSEEGSLTSQMELKNLSKKPAAEGTELQEINDEAFVDSIGNSIICTKNGLQGNIDMLEDGLLVDVMKIKETDIVNLQRRKFPLTNDTCVKSSSDCGQATERLDNVGANNAVTCMTPTNDDAKATKLMSSDLEVHLGCASSVFEDESHQLSSYRYKRTVSEGLATQSSFLKPEKPETSSQKPGKFVTDEVITSQILGCTEFSVISEMIDKEAYQLKKVKVPRDENPLMRTGMITENKLLPDLITLLECLRMISSHKFAPFFKLRPDIQTNARYKSVIKRHMDLNAVRNKLEEGKYSANGEFFRDMLLIFNNALVFYSKESREYGAAHVLREFLIKEMERLLKTETSDRSSSINQVVKGSESKASSINDSQGWLGPVWSSSSNHVSGKAELDNEVGVKEPEVAPEIECNESDKSAMVKDLEQEDRLKGKSRTVRNGSKTNARKQQIEDMKMEVSGVNEQGVIPIVPREGNELDKSPIVKDPDRPKGTGRSVRKGNKTNVHKRHIDDEKTETLSGSKERISREKHMKISEVVSAKHIPKKESLASQISSKESNLKRERADIRSSKYESVRKPTESSKNSSSKRSARGASQFKQNVPKGNKTQQSQKRARTRL